MRTQDDIRDIAAYVERTYDLDENDVIRLCEELKGRSPRYTRDELTAIAEALGYNPEAFSIDPKYIAKAVEHHKDDDDEELLHVIDHFGQSRYHDHRETVVLAKIALALRPQQAKQEEKPWDFSDNVRQHVADKLGEDVSTITNAEIYQAVRMYQFTSHPLLAQLVAAAEEQPESMKELRQLLIVAAVRKAEAEEIPF